jgi:glycosyltransferase involved in cell wall biosynthesis
MPAMSQPLRVTAVVPIYNERENIPRLYPPLTQALESLQATYEILFVDDGSTDGSRGELWRLAEADPRVKVVALRRNFGQTAAMQAGIDVAGGEIIVTLDGDLQNDPEDIPRMIACLDEGYDLIHGWRRVRHDAWLHRKLPSKIANWLISRTTGFPIHDLGCTLKAIRAEIARDLELYGEMHRFIPILAWQRGARCCEMEVRHHPRRFGKTKYGLSRVTRVLLDLATVKFLLSWLNSPMKLFGRLGVWSFSAGLASLSTTIAMKVLAGIDMTGNPLLLLAVMFWLSGMQLVSLGLLGEMTTRTYFDKQGRRPYVIQKIWNGEHRDSDAPRRAA